MRNVVLSMIVAAGLTLPGAPASAQFRYVESGLDLPQESFMSDVMTGLGDALNKGLDFPRTILMTTRDCGESNAYFLPGSGQNSPAVVFCTELIWDIAAAAQRQPEAQFATAFASSVTFILLHEFGHAIISELNLAPTGLEEDAVDQFAALVLSGQPEMARYAAEFWSHQGSSEPGILERILFPSAAGERSRASFADEHSLNEQRFFNIICWTYGAAPSERQHLVNLGFIPTTRAARCPAEFDQLSRGWNALLEPHRTEAVPGVFPEVDLKNTKKPVGSKQVPSPDPEPAPQSAPSSAPNLSGTWAFSESVADSRDLLRCSNSGSLSLAQQETALGGSMSQDGTCWIFGEAIDNGGSGAIGASMVTPGEAHFQIGNCTYRVSAWNLAEGRMEGQVECRESFIGQSFTLSGTWSALRQNLP